MRRLLLLISLYCAIGPYSSYAQDAYPLLLAGGESARWNISLEHGKMTLTGICLVRQTEHGLVGSVINEFGFRAFDFTYQRGKMKILNVMTKMNRWYIRRLLRTDLRILAADSPVDIGRKRTLETHLPDSMTLCNHRHNVCYRFERIKDLD